MDDQGYIYDVAVSFAGEQRNYVEAFVRECESRGLKVFYDADKAIDFWGRNFIFEFRRMYGGTQPRVVVPFISKEYLAKPYPMDEFAAAVEQGFQRADVYILPVVVGEVHVPPELLNPAVGFLRADDHTPAQLADRTVARIGRVQPAAAAPTTPSFRSPRVTPTSFNPREILESALQTVGTRFRQSATSALERYGYTCHISQDASGLDIRVAHAGRPACGMSLWFDDNNAFGGRNRLAMSFAWPASNRSSMNGWVSAAWNPDDPSAVLKFTDFSLGATEQVLTADQFIAALWEKILNFIEQQVR